MNIEDQPWHVQKQIKELQALLQDYRSAFPATNEV